MRLTRNCCKPITITISPVPKITFNPDTLVIKPGQSISLNPVVTGDANIFQWSPSNGLSNPSVINPIANPTATIVYQLLATNNAGCKSSGGETVLVYHPLAMPSAFSPNGDGINDVFRIPPSVSQQIKSFTVFNRWGELVFNTTDSGKGWDGKLNSITQSDGTYVWVIVYYNIMTKQIETAKGTVTLIR